MSISQTHGVNNRQNDKFLRLSRVINSEVELILLNVMMHEEQTNFEADTSTDFIMF